MSIPPAIRCLPIAAVLFAATAAFAELRALDHEFRPTAEELEIPDRCVGADGATARLRIVCSTLDEFGSCGWRSAVVDWRDAAEQVVAGPHVLHDRTTNSVDRSFACNDHGLVMAAIDDQFWMVDRGGIRGWPQPLVNVAEYVEKVGWRDGFFAVWAEDRAIRGRFYDGDGRQLAPDLEVASERPHWWAAQSDEDGRVLIAWSTYEPDIALPKVYATLIEDGTVVSPPIQLNEFPGGGGILQIKTEGPRRFLVSWEQDRQAGRVGRRVTADDSVVTTTTSTTTLPAHVPEFVDFGILAEPFVLDYEDPPYEPAVAGDRKGRWVATWRDKFDSASGAWPYFGSVFSTSTDDARRWSAPRSVIDGSFPASLQASLATNQNGVWILAWAPREEPWILTRRSSDGGKTWDPTVAHPELHVANPPSAEQLSLAAGHDGIWVAAWIERAWRDVDEYSGNEMVCEVHAAVSGDSGRGWRPSRKLAETQCDESSHGLKVATDRDGNWLIAWITDRVYGVTSRDNALTWSDRSVLVEDSQGSPHGIDVAADGHGNWLMAYVGTNHSAFSWRIFVSRSRDPGSEWTTPAGIAPWHDVEGGLDDSPSISSSGKGRWGIVWRTYTDMNGNGLDADIASSFSNDAGSTWSTPRPVERDAIGDSRDDASPHLAYAGAATWVTVWRSVEVTESGAGTIRFARTRGACGNGKRELAEECDDGNDDNDDGCDSNCLVSGCGNVILTTGEECDDGNDDDSDDCVSDCRAADCGDGFVHAELEECDDGNAFSDDACSMTCTTSGCGDGVVWTGVEACDDGNDDNNDGCLRDCRIATCGDGYLALGVEECDDANGDYGDGCAQCTMEACSPSAPLATATIALRVLRKAVGLPVRCRPSECDRDGNGRITTIDALDTLRAAVAPAVFRCSAISSVLVRMGASEPMGALQFELSYRDSAAQIAMVNGQPACTILVEDIDVWTAMNVEPLDGSVRLGMITLGELRGPLDLLRCDFEEPVAPSAKAFSVTLEDATDGNGLALRVPPSFEVVPQ